MRSILMVAPKGLNVFKLTFIGSTSRTAERITSMRGKDPYLLSQREWDLLRAVEAGSKTERQLAAALGVSAPRISTLKRHIKAKLRVENWEQALAYARESFDLSQASLPQSSDGYRKTGRA